MKKFVYNWYHLFPKSFSAPSGKSSGPEVLFARGYFNYQFDFLNWLLKVFILILK